MNISQKVLFTQIENFLIFIKDTASESAEASFVEELSLSTSESKNENEQESPSSTSLPLSPAVSILPEPIEVSVERVSPRSMADPYPKKRTTCQVCNKKFRSLAQLEQHTRAVHEKSADTRPHKCPLCPAKFKVSGTLVTHLR